MTSNKQGLTLLEVLFSVVLLSAATLFILNSLPSLMASSYRAEEEVIVGAILRSAVDQQMALPGSDLSERSYHEEVSGRTFRVTVVPFEIPGHKPQRLTGVHVLISWESPFGKRLLEEEVWVSHVPR